MPFILPVVSCLLWLWAAAGAVFRQMKRLGEKREAFRKEVVVGKADWIIRNMSVFLLFFFAMSLNNLNFRQDATYFNTASNDRNREAPQTQPEVFQWQSGRYEAVTGVIIISALQFVCLFVWVLFIYLFILVQTNDGQRPFSINARIWRRSLHKHGLALPSGGCKRPHATTNQWLVDSRSGS